MSMIAPSILRLTEAVRSARKRTQLQPLEKRLTVSMRHAFTVQGRAVLTAFRPLERLFTKPVVVKEAAEESDWGPRFDEAALATLSLFEEPLADIAQAALAAGIRSQIARVGVDISFDLEHPAAVDWLQIHGADLVTGINETTRSGLRTILTQAADEGWSYNRTATAIKAKYDGFANGVPQKHITSRAHMIAVTEVGNAYEAGAMLVGQQLQAAGIRMEKSWSNVAGACPLCLENAAVGWIPFDRPFPNGAMQPLQHPACRCSLLQRRAVVQ